MSNRPFNAMTVKSTFIPIIALLFMFSFFFDAGAPPSAFAQDNIFTDNVGVGTTAPVSKLDVSGTAYLRGDTGDNGLFVEAGGNVGIGTTNPAAILDIGGSTSTITNASGDITITPAVNLIVSSGDVGIGTTDPQGLLDIDGDGGTVDGFVFSNFGATATGIDFSNSGLLTWEGYPIALDGNNIWRGDGLLAAGIFGSTSHLFLDADTDDDIRFSIGGISNEKMRLNASGYVGIGTTDPSAQLELSGATMIADSNTVNFADTTDGYVLTFDTTSQTWAGEESSGTASLWTDTNGDTYLGTGGTASTDNVGIGTTDPDTLLRIDENNNAIAFTVTGGGGGYALGRFERDIVDSGIIDIVVFNDDPLVHFDPLPGSGTEWSAGVADNANDSFVIQSGDLPSRTTRLTIDTAGLVGIGTTNPTDKLDIAGAVKIGSGYVGIGTTAPQNGMLIEGYVGIGTTNPAVALQVDGDFNVNIPGSTDGTILNADTSTGIVTVDALQLGSVSFEENAGVVSWIDLPVTTTTSGLQQSYTAQMDSNPLLMLYSVTDGSGGVTDLGVGIGMTNPSDLLDVAGAVKIGSGYAGIGTTAPANGMLIEGNVGIGTTNPGAQLELSGATMMAASNTIDFTDVTDGYVLTFDTTSQTWAGEESSGTASLWTDTNGDTYLGTGGTASTDNVGIGTTDPWERFCVEASLGDYVAIMPDDPSVTMAVNRSGESARIQVTGQSGVQDSYISFDTGNSDDWSVGLDDSDNQNFKISRNDTFGTNDYFVIEAATGDVGIGTTNPVAALDVAGTSFLRGDTGDNGLFVEAGGNVGIGTTNPTSKLDIGGSSATISNTAGNITITPASNLIVSSGNVGIGTTNPGAQLELSGATMIANANTVDFTDVTDGYVLTFDTTSQTWAGEESSGTASLWTDTNGITYLGTGGTPSGDNVGIGTAGPTDILDIAGALKIGSSYAGIGTTAPANGMLIEGYVGIGTTNPNMLLEVANPSNGGQGFQYSGSDNFYNSNAYYTGSQWNRIQTSRGSFNMVHRTNDSEGRTDFRLAASGANPITWTTAMTIKNTGNVGIGTTAPSDKLDIAGAVKIGSGYAGIGTTAPANGMLIEGNVGIGTTNPTEELEVYGTGNQYLKINSTDYNEAGVIFQRGTDSDVYSDWKIYGKAGKLHIGYSDSGSAFDERVTFRNLSGMGCVGIGTTDPQERFVIDFDGDNYIYWDLPQNDVSSLVFGEGSDIMRLSYRGDYGSGDENALAIEKEDGTNLVTIKRGGNVGIGTTNPGTTLHVESVNEITAIFSGLSGEDSTIVLGGNTTGRTGEQYVTYQNDQTGGSGWLVGMGDDEDFYFDYSSVGELNEAGSMMMIEQSGNVGIGTTDPSADLDVVGTAEFDITDFEIQTTTDSTTAVQVLDQAGNTVFNIDTENERVGIGTTAPTGKLEVGGTPSTITNASGDITITPAVNLIVSSGNVGIGTTNPGAKLELSTATMIADSNTINFSDVTDGYVLTFNTATDTWSGEVSAGGSSLWTDTNGITYLGTGGTASTDNVGIGTTNPTEQLTIDVPVGDVAIYTRNTTDPNGWKIWSNANSSYLDSYLNNMRLQTTRDSDDIIFITNSSEAMRIDATNGNVGIGTTDPDELLHVHWGTPAGAIIQKWSSDRDGGEYLTLGYGLGANGFVFQSSSGRDFIIDVGGSVGIGDYSPDAHLEVSADGTSGGNIFLLSSDDDNNGDILTVLESGNVGIGTTDPTSRLSIGGATSTISNASGDLTITPASDLIVSSGNVGIGTTNPTVALDVVGQVESDTAFRVSVTGNQTNTKFGYGSNLGMFFPNSGIAFTTGGVEKIRINSSGYVGIGTTNPTTQLELSGATMMANANTVDFTDVTDGYVLTFDTNTQTWAGDVGGGTSLWSENGASITYLGTGGTASTDSVGIGTTNPTSTLEIVSTGSLKIPSDDNPTVDAEGELAWENDDDHLHMFDGSNDIVLAGKTKSISFIIKCPEGGDDFVLWQTPRHLEITAVSAICFGESGSSVTGQIQEYTPTGTTPADGDGEGDWPIGLSEYTDSSWTGGAFDDGVDAGDWIGWKTTSVSGYVNFVSVTVEYYET